MTISPITPNLLIEYLEAKRTTLGNPEVMENRKAYYDLVKEAAKVNLPKAIDWAYELKGIDWRTKALIDISEELSVVNQKEAITILKSANYWAIRLYNKDKLILGLCRIFKLQMKIDPKAAKDTMLNLMQEIKEQSQKKVSQDFFQSSEIKKVISECVSCALELKDTKQDSEFLKLLHNMLSLFPVNVRPDLKLMEK